jgi:hypothetical protein
MTDDTLERDLRDLLARRDPGPARAALGAGIRARLADEAARPRRLPRRLSEAAMSGAAVAAVMLLALVVFRPPGVGPGSSPPLVPGQPYVLRAGDGVVDGPAPPVVQAALALLAIVALIATALTRRERRTRILAWLAGLTVLYVSLSAAGATALAFRNGMYGVDPGRVPDGLEPGMYVAVEGDRPFTLSLTLTNVSSLPLTIVGLERTEVAGGADGRTLVPRFVGLAVRTETAPGRTEPAPLGRATLQPNEERDFAILGLAGACSLATPGPDGQAGYELATVSIVYEQLTVERTARVALPAPVVITTSGTCT